jgi:hypothetical protein
VDAVEANIPQDDHLRDLQPIGLISDRRANRVRHYPAGRHDHPGKQDDQTELDQGPVHKIINQVVVPMAPEDLLPTMHGHEPLKRHEDHARNEKISETEPVHNSRGEYAFSQDACANIREYRI